MRPHRSVGAGRARGAFRNVPSSWSLSQKHRHLIALLGGAFFLPAGKEVEAAGPLERAF